MKSILNFNIVEKAIMFSLTSLVAVTWTMLVFHMVTEGIVASSFGIYG
jgi:hypothetical protein